MISISLLLEVVAKTESEAKTLLRSLKVLYLQVFGSGISRDVFMSDANISLFIKGLETPSASVYTSCLTAESFPSAVKDAISYFQRKGSWFISVYSTNTVAGTLHDSRVVRALCP